MVSCVSVRLKLDFRSSARCHRNCSSTTRPSIIESQSLEGDRILDAYLLHAFAE